MVPSGYLAREEIHRGRRRVVVRGIRRADDLPVIIKTAAEEFPLPAQTAALRREYEILGSLDFAGVARP
ncbi:MAG: hypothetical protein ACRDHY_16410, partial [Anaerolineales bacterium]